MQGALYTSQPSRWSYWNCLIFRIHSSPFEIHLWLLLCSNGIEGKKASERYKYLFSSDLSLTVGAVYCVFSRLWVIRCNSFSLFMWCFSMSGNFQKVYTFLIGFTSQTTCGCARCARVPYPVLLWIWVIVESMDIGVGQKYWCVCCGSSSSGGPGSEEAAGGNSRHRRNRHGNAAAPGGLERRMEELEKVLKIRLALAFPPEVCNRSLPLMHWTHWISASIAVGEGSALGLSFTSWQLYFYTGLSIITIQCL